MASPSARPIRIASASVSFNPAPVSSPSPALLMIRALPLATARSCTRRWIELLIEAARVEFASTVASWALSSASACSMPSTCDLAWKAMYWRANALATTCASLGVAFSAEMSRTSALGAASTLTPESTRFASPTVLSWLATALATSLDLAMTTLVAAARAGSSAAVLTPSAVSERLATLNATDAVAS